MLIKKLIISASIACCSLIGNAQDSIALPSDSIALPIALTDSVATDSIIAPPPIAVCDSLAAVMDSIGFVVQTEPLPQTMFLPAVYMGYDTHAYAHAERVINLHKANDTIPEWLGRKVRSRRFANALMQHLAMTRLDVIPYNIATLPEPPKKYIAIADPMSTVTVFKEIGGLPEKVTADKPENVAAVEINKQHWLNKLALNLQFSQAYISPNWYEGGNNSLSLIADFTYQSNLNTKFHPNLLFENFFQWKTVLTSAPDDPYRPYSLSENRFQVNSKFGYKAIKNWYYTINAMLKTPIFNGYKSGTETRTASFLSPGELNFGLGVTFNTKTKNDKFSLGLTISPLSYNLKTVIDKHVSETDHGLKPGRKGHSSFGSNMEIKWEWKMFHNVNWTSRIYAFSNYHYFQGDWQNTFNFTINRFFTARLSVDLRYDTSVKNPSTSWKLLQLREMLSLGFTYTITH